MFKGSQKGRDRHCNSLFIGINTDCTLQGACEPSTHLTVATVCQHICNTQTEEQSALHKVDSYSYTFDHRLILLYSGHIIVSSNIQSRAVRRMEGLQKVTKLSVVGGPLGAAGTLQSISLMCLTALQWCENGHFHWNNGHFFDWQHVCKDCFLHSSN